MFLTLFQMFESESNGFVAAQTASKQQGKKRAISFALELLAVRRLPERQALLNSQPLTQAHTEIPRAFDAANPSGEIGAQQTRVGCLIGEAPNGTKAQIDGSWGKQASLEVAAITENHGSVQSQSRFRATPIDELVDGMTISPSAIDAGQAAQYCRFRELEIRQTQTGFGVLTLFRGMRLLLHRPLASSP
jgi:hypothetical protein